MAMTKVEAEVTGKVWKVVAAPGDALAAEDAIVIIESMKMEIPVMAPRAGKLLRVLVKEGDQVGEGQIVAEME
ncbi:MAG: biotin/lipoyl-binding carrier protein [Acidobacteriia bacterium]|nr:biotin/lipoyl-binding carrier protein [Terriglobia bacterium]